jgi:hypothetical protein
MFFRMQRRPKYGLEWLAEIDAARLKRDEVSQTRQTWMTIGALGLSVLATVIAVLSWLYPHSGAP